MKKRRVLSIVMVALMLLQLLPGVAFAEQQTTVPDGFIGIYDTEDMELLQEHPEGQFILMNDIVFDDPEQGGYNFETISLWPHFSGELDGNGYAIKNM